MMLKKILKILLSILLPIFLITNSFVLNGITYIHIFFWFFWFFYIFNIFKYIKGNSYLLLATPVVSVWGKDHKLNVPRWSQKDCVDAYKTVRKSSPNKPYTDPEEKIKAAALLKKKISTTKISTIKAPADQEYRIVKNAKFYIKKYINTKKTPGNLENKISTIKTSADPEYSVSKNVKSFLNKYFTPPTKLPEHLEIKSFAINPEKKIKTLSTVVKKKISTTDSPWILESKAFIFKPIDLPKEKIKSTPVKKEISGDLEGKTSGNLENKISIDHSERKIKTASTLIKKKNSNIKTHVDSEHNVIKMFKHLKKKYFTTKVPIDPENKITTVSAVLKNKPKKVITAWESPIKNWEPKFDRKLTCFQKNKYNTTNLVETYLTKRKMHVPPNSHINTFNNTPENLRALNKARIHCLRGKADTFVNGLQKNTGKTVEDIVQTNNLKLFKKILNRKTEPKFIIGYDRPRMTNFKGEVGKNDEYLNWYPRKWSEFFYQEYIDQYLFTVPLVLMFLFVHWVIAETILIKFKCQQHYYFNTWVLGVGALYIYYVYQHLSQGVWLLPKRDSFGNIIGYFSLWPAWFGVEWPIYSILYQWWLFLAYYTIIVICFYFLAPNSPYLRSNKIFKPSNQGLLFIICIMLLIMPPIFSQKRLPFWMPVENVLIGNNLHYGIIYIIVIFFLLGIFSVVFYYAYIIILNFSKYKYYNDETFLSQIDFLLFNDNDDNSDWDIVHSKPKMLVQLVENPEEWAQGWNYYSINNSIYNLKEAWVGSQSFNILVYCVTINGLLALTLKSFYMKGASLPAITIFLFLFFVIIFICLLLFIKYYLKKTLLVKVKNIFFFLFIGIFIIFFVIFFYKDFVNVFLNLFKNE